MALDGVDAVLNSSWGLVFPSRAIETGGPPLAVADALMNGVPVIARTNTSASDFIEDHGVGATYDRDPIEALRLVKNAGPTLGSRARAVFLAELGVDQWQDRLSKLYQDLLRQDGGRRLENGAGSID
jgi:glycosyltransferase involved in cell wall biosynthesis